MRVSDLEETKAYFEDSLTNTRYPFEEKFDNKSMK